jgi:hypothetical protein
LGAVYPERMIRVTAIGFDWQRGLAGVTEKTLAVIRSFSLIYE